MWLIDYGENKVFVVVGVFFNKVNFFRIVGSILGFIFKFVNKSCFGFRD